MKKILLLFVISFFLIGCASTQMKEENEKLKADLAEANKKQLELESQLKARDDLFKAEQEKHQKEMDEAAEKFKEEVKNGDVNVKSVKGGISVAMADRLFFDNGKADIKPEGKKVLKRIADMVKGMPDKIVRIDGHTDNNPIKPGSELSLKYPTNWELAAGRSVNVLRYLTEKCGVKPEIIFASSHSFYRPIESNDTKKGRAKNRRIEIILIDKNLAQTVEPEKE